MKIKINANGTVRKQEPVSTKVVVIVDTLGLVVAFGLLLITLFSGNQVWLNVGMALAGLVAAEVSIHMAALNKKIAEIQYEIDTVKGNKTVTSAVVQNKLDGLYADKAKQAGDVALMQMFAALAAFIILLGAYSK
ncbi:MULTISPECIES: hypothetical protein [Actinomycetes]|jgi:hypothetical protein|uniref:hypothetical protein n=1 Tax=Actinomycetes TaxID=1760 RepID=UPI002648DDE0|nr:MULTISPECIES: hypothetical protein [Actinomycetes]MDN5973384.1 hypothetical protein [Bifidobacterium crudilactis]MDN6234496.1 hypothetical protein [Bifidobacterium crudilactis]MDN6274220.1 hypothetical protein [Corynebacterium casei]MDN6468177.1 hypothetical protein [Bifidobacterium crudilactis]MDN6587428.1 hypothetical protein [Bifidobacterium crudilactis]